MKVYFNDDNYATRIPVKSWANDIEASTLDQAKDLANLPFAFKHIALMPDAHLGYGMPIGGVLATKGAVIPNAVGYDIGCGMIALKTRITNIDKETLKDIKEVIKKQIPTGEKHHKESQSWFKWDVAPDIPIIQQELESAKHQLGTLGSGNHFVEIQKGSDGFVWIMIHSGSRNFGCKIAQHYHKVAKELCEKWYSDIPSKDLSFLPIGTPEAKEYMEAMNYALAFAKANRFVMMNKVEEILSNYFNCEIPDYWYDVHHNYAQWENHFKQNVIIHRKGATSAKKKEIGIIPGSQGSKSYIVEGLGNPQSFNSCSHGAGRKMGRKNAKKTLDLATEVKKLNDQGILHTVRGIDDLDEADGAYKDITVVMANQADLVKIITELTPLATIKGKNKARKNNKL